MSVEPVEIEFLMRDRMSGAMAHLETELDDVQGQVVVLTAAISSLEGKLDELRASNIDLSQEDNIQQVNALTEKIEQLKTQRDALGKQSTPLQVLPPTSTVEQAAGRISALNFSIQQLAREMPSLAMGPQMFFMAISNNLPVFADELKRARLEYQALMAAGQKATPVWRQILSSLLSWQTALTVGVTLLVMYSKEIGAWVGSLFGASSELKKLEEARRKDLEAEVKAVEHAAKYRAELVQTMNAIKAFSGTREEERQMVDKLNLKYGETFGYMSTLSSWYDTLKSKAEDYTRVLFLQSRQQALIDEAVKLEGEKYHLQNADAKDLDGAAGFWDGVLANMSAPYASPKKIIAEQNEANRARKIAEVDAKLAEVRQKLESTSRELSGRSKETAQQIPAGSLADINNRLNLANKELQIAETDEKRAEVRRRIRQLETERDRLMGSSHKGPQKQDGALERVHARKAEFAEYAETLRIESMQEGYAALRDKERSEHKQRLSEIDKREQEILSKYKTLRKQGVKIASSADAEVRLTASVARARSASILDKRLAQIDVSERKEREEQIEKLLAPYRGYAESRLKIEQEYQQKLQAIRGSGRGSSTHEHELALERDKELESLDRRFAERESGFQRLMSRISSMGIDQLKQALRQAEEALAQAHGSSQEDDVIASLRAQISALRKQLNIKENERDANQSDPAQKWERTKKALSGAKGKLDEMSESLELLDEASKGVIQTALNISSAVLSMIDGISSLSASSAEKISMLEKASVILTVISAAFRIFNSVASGAAEAGRIHNEALAEIQQSRLQYQREYNNLLAEQNLLFKEGVSIFGEQEIEKASNALQVYAKAVSDLEIALKGADPGESYRAFSKPFFWSTSEWIIENAHREKLFKQSREAYERGLGALGEVHIVTGHRKTGLFGWGKGADVYDSLLTVFPQVVKATGDIDREMLKSIISTQKMSDASKKTLQGLLDLMEQADKAKEQFSSYLKDTYGDLGDNMVSAITTALKEGKSAVELFAKDVSNVVEKLGEQLAYSLFFANVFKDLEARLTDIYGRSDKLSSEEIARLANQELEQFYRSSSALMPQAQKFLEEWRRQAEASGFSAYRGAGLDQRGHAGAFTTMTQEQAHKLEGLFVAGEVHWANIDEAVSGLLKNTMQWGDLLGRIAQHTAYIERIYVEFSEIKRDGIKVK